MSKITRRKTLARGSKAVMAAEPPDGQPANLWLRWVEKERRAFEATRDRRIKEMIQAVIVEGMSPEEYRAKWRAERLAGRAI